MPAHRPTFAWFALVALSGSLQAGCVIERVGGPQRSGPVAPPARVTPLPPAPLAPGFDPAQAVLDLRRQLLPAAKANPEGERYFLAHTSGPAKPFAQEGPASLTAIAVMATGHAEARGRTPDSTLYGATLNEGERAELLLAPTPSCITAVAHGGIGVMEVDLFIVTGPPESPTIVAQDERAGPGAVVGGQGMCVAVSGGAARIAAIVRRGAGPVVMGVYR